MEKLLIKPLSLQLMSAFKGLDITPEQKRFVEDKPIAQYHLDMHLNLHKKSNQTKKEQEINVYGIFKRREPVGMFTLRQAPDFKVSLCAFFIDRHHQGKGYGAQALGWIKQYSEAMGANKIDLLVHNENPAVSLYKGFGFVNRGYWQQSQDILMECYL